MSVWVNRWVYGFMINNGNCGLPMVSPSLFRRITPDHWKLLYFDDLSTNGP